MGLLDLYEAQDEPCVHCGKLLWPYEVTYWKQISKPVQVRGVWKCLFIPGVDKPFCDAYCSLEFEKSGVGVLDV